MSNVEPIKLTPELIHGFSQSCLQERYDNPQPTPSFHDELWGYCCSDHKQVAIGAPRGHAKSTAVTHAYTLAAGLFRAADHIMIVSDTEKQGSSFLSDIKMELEENEKIRELFQVKKFLKDSETELIFQMGDDGHRVRIIVRTALGSMRGAKWRGKRPNLIIIDDLENDEAVMNEERRAKLREWFYGALLPAGSDYAKIRMVGTVLHFDSLLERLMPQTAGEHAKTTITEGLKQYSTRKDTPWFSIKYRAHTDFDDFTEILWPEKFDEKRLRAIRDDYVSQSYSEGYSQEYLNYPISEQSAFFKKTDFIPMDTNDHECHKTYYSAIDFAISKKAKRSFTVILTAGVDEQGYVHIVDVIRRRMDSKEIVDEILSTTNIYDPDLFIMEEGALRKAIGPFLQAEMLRTGIFPNIHPKVPENDKRSRARAIQGRMRQGGVKFDMDAEWYPGLEQEMLRFDRGEYDDQVDAISWIGLVLNEMREAPTKEELDDMEYEEDVMQDESYMYEGQNSTTGY